jgi:hypothetical protein
VIFLYICEYKMAKNRALHHAVLNVGLEVIHCDLLAGAGQLELAASQHNVKEKCFGIALPILVSRFGKNSSTSRHFLVSQGRCLIWF